VGVHVRQNRDWWNAASEGYQDRHARTLTPDTLSWGAWRAPESELLVLGDVADRDVLEIGCGAAQSSIALALLGARPVGLDVSEAQLAHGRQLMAGLDLEVPLIHGNAEQLPFGDDRFDLVFCDYGAMTFASPLQAVPEAARVLRPGGVLAFTTTTPLLFMCWPDGEMDPGTTLTRDYFGMHEIDDGGVARFSLGYGEWIRLFRECGLIVEDLIELRPGPEDETSFGPPGARAWSRRFPAEHVWKVRSAGVAGAR
jgi:SAM-dependent methyltransferase